MSFFVLQCVAAVILVCCVMATILLLEIAAMGWASMAVTILFFSGLVVGIWRANGWR